MTENLQARYKRLQYKGHGEDETMESFFHEHKDVATVGGNEIVLTEDVRKHDVYFEEHYYAILDGEGKAWTSRRKLTLPQVLQLVDGAPSKKFYIQDSPIQVQLKQKVEKTSGKRKPIVKVEKVREADEQETGEDARD